MARYIDANKIRLTAETSIDHVDLEAYVPLSAVRRAIALTPTEDVVKVVRCKDCKYNHNYWNPYDFEQMRCHRKANIPRDDWYCANGERRVENETIH